MKSKDWLLIEHLLNHAIDAHVTEEHGHSEPSMTIGHCAVAGVTQTIEQELESGLKASGYESERGEDSCTAIFLPMAKYEEWVSFCVHTGQHNTDAFHDIPVYGVEGLDKIKYCCW